MKSGVNQYRIEWRGRMFAAGLSLFEALNTADLLAAVSGFDKPDPANYLKGYRGIILRPYHAKMAELPELPDEVKAFLKACRALNGRGLKNKVPTVVRPSFVETVPYHYGTGWPARSKITPQRIIYTSEVAGYYRPGGLAELQPLLEKLRAMPKSARYDYLRERGWPCRKARELSNI